MSLVVAGHRDGDGRAGVLGADQHAFHRAFLRGGDLARQRSRRLRVESANSIQPKRDCKTDACDQRVNTHAILPDIFIIGLEA